MNGHCEDCATVSIGDRLLGFILLAVGITLMIMNEGCQ